MYFQIFLSIILKTQYVLIISECNFLHKLQCFCTLLLGIQTKIVLLTAFFRVTHVWAVVLLFSSFVSSKNCSFLFADRTRSICWKFDSELVILNIPFLLRFFKSSFELAFVISSPSFSHPIRKVYRATLSLLYEKITEQIFTDFYRIKTITQQSAWMWTQQYVIDILNRVPDILL